MKEKAEFIAEFDEMQTFDNWAYQACLFSESIDDENRARLKYTWADFNALTTEQQSEFCDALGTPAFEAWMSVAQRKPGLVPLYIINPLRCSWSDFEAMHVSKKEALFESFETAEAFNEWMEKAQEIPQLSPALVEDYQNCTWAEFSVMPVAQKEAFFELFEEAEDFEAWMNAAKRKMKKPSPI